MTRQALEQIKTVCVDNAAPSCKHRMALDFVRQIASDALRDTTTGHAQWDEMAEPNNARLTPDLMNRTTVSAVGLTGRTITIDCDSVETKDAIMDALVNVALAPVETDKTMDAILSYLTKKYVLVYDELSAADFDHIRGLINGAQAT